LKQLQPVIDARAALLITVEQLKQTDEFPIKL